LLTSHEMMDPAEMITILCRRDRHFKDLWEPNI
jgi:hypothetical protein